MPRQDGAFMEKLVQLIEQSIEPDSIGERNVRLPILTSPTASTAQRDIVICKGRPPRQTITIVEVQDRQKPVDMNEFRGWLSKLKDVGAQHLYCVSGKSFSKSINSHDKLFPSNRHNLRWSKDFEHLKAIFLETLVRLSRHKNSHPDCQFYRLQDRFRQIQRFHYIEMELPPYLKS
jgi:hypothetical protein